MKAFIVTVMVLFIINALIELYWLATHNWPPRSAGTISLDVVFQFLLVAWAVWLFAREGQ